MKELDYFSTALALQQKFQHLCQGWHNKHACELPCTGEAHAITCSAPTETPVQAGSYYFGQFVSALQDFKSVAVKTLIV
jgi:hypothetical protein